MSRTWLACALLAALPTALAAQKAPEAMSPLEIAVACAPPPRITAPTATLQIAGSADTLRRSVFANRDQVVIAGGTDNGVDVGQRYFIRRDVSQAGDTADPGMYVAAGHVIHTVGWLRIVAADKTTAVAAIDFTCGAAATGDYLEPFQAPSVPAALTSTAKLRDLDFSSPARILFGDHQQISAGVGDFVIIDRGTSSGLANGARFGIYRDMRVPKVPLASVGEAVVVSESADVAVVRIVRARDAVFSGDFAVPEKK